MNRESRIYSNRSDENSFNEYLIFIAIRHVRHSRITTKFHSPNYAAPSSGCENGFYRPNDYCPLRRILFESGSNP